MEKKWLLFLMISLVAGGLYAQSCDGYLKSHDSLFVQQTFSISGSSDLIVSGSIGTYNNRRFLSRMGANGNFIWVKRLGNLGNFGGYSIVCDGSAIYEVADTLANNDYECHLKKYNLSGAQILDFPLPLHAAITDLELDASGNLFLYGFAGDTVVAGSNVLAPNTQSASGIYENEVILKYSPALSLQWAKFLCTWTVSSAFFNSGYGELLVDQTNGDVYYLNSGNPLSNFSVDFGASQLVNSPGNKNILVKLNTNGTCQWAQLTTATPPVSDGWTLQNSRIIVASRGIPNILPAYLDSYSTSTGSLISSFSHSVTNSFFPSYLFGNNAFYAVCSEQSPFFDRHFIEKFDMSFNLQSRRYYGNSVSSSYQGFTQASLVNNAIYYGMSWKKSYVYGPNLFYQQIPPNDSLTFYGKVNLDLNALRGNVIGPASTIQCGQSHTIQLMPTLFSPFDQNLSGLNVVWTPSVGVSSPNSFSVTLSPATTTTYLVTWGDGTCTVTDTAEINVDPISVFNYTINNMVVNFSKQGTQCNSFLWDFGNGNTSTINPDPVVTYASPGTYGVCLQCDGSSACTKCVNITVPGNGTGGVGIKELAGSQHFALYPNPTPGPLHLSRVGGQELGHHLEILDVLGHVVFQKQLSETSIEIDLTEQTKGMYFLKISSEDGSYKIFKIAKE